jgi:AAA15 family ATPase/GTPase
MLINFTVGNFLSFKTQTKFSLKAEFLKEPTKRDFIFSAGEKEIDLIKCAAIFGPNGTGKSNLIKALDFVLRFIRNSATDRQLDQEIEISPFKLSTDFENKPSFFEIEFLSNNIIYRYGFKVTRKNIIEEWLYCTKKLTEYNLFLRVMDRFTINKNKMTESDETIQSKTRPNALFLSALANWNEPISKSIVEGLNKIRIYQNLEDRYNFSQTFSYVENKDYKDKILHLLKQADFDIKDIRTVHFEMKEEFLKLFGNNTKLVENFTKSIKTTRNKYDEFNHEAGTVDFDLFLEESQGTLKLISIAGPMIEALAKGHVLIIDEFTARLHPFLSEFIIQKFNSINNITNAQLIFTSHNYFVMSKKLLRRDQVFFTFKHEHATQITTLFKEGVRHDASFFSKYLSSNFAKPNITNDPPSVNDQLDLF